MEQAFVTGIFRRASSRRKHPPIAVHLPERYSRAAFRWLYTESKDSKADSGSALLLTKGIAPTCSAHALSRTSLPPGRGQKLSR